MRPKRTASVEIHRFRCALIRALVLLVFAHPLNSVRAQSDPSEMESAHAERPFPLQGEWSGNITPQWRLFPEKPDSGPAYTSNLSLAIEPEYYLEWAGGKQSFTFEPFLRLDQHDGRRTHFDIRELNWLYVAGDWEWRIGIGKVFWGVTEFVHLIDIVNQTDAIENIDDEDRLGQPMINVSWVQDWGALQVFVLPYFRERTFPGRDARPRTARVVDTARAQYESGAGQHHIDFALRATTTIGLADVGLYQFVGTDRDPQLLLGTDKAGRAVLIPRYNQIKQTGLEIQTVVGDWLWKLEGLYQDNPVKDYFAAIGGFEYTFVGVFETVFDVGVVAEYSYDTRKDESISPFQNDIFLGARLTFNDAQSTEILAGGAWDLSNQSRTLRIETSRRFGDSWKLSLELSVFSNITEGDILFDLRDDDFVQLDFGYFF